MACMDSDEEEAWGGAKQQTNTRSTTPITKHNNTGNGSGNGTGKAPHRNHHASGKERFQARRSPPLRSDQNPSPPSLSGVGVDLVAGDLTPAQPSNPTPAHNSVRIDLCEWSDDDLVSVGDGRGGDAKLKRYAAQSTVEEVMAIIDMRPSESATAIDKCATSTSECTRDTDSVTPTAAAPVRFDYLVKWKSATLRAASWEPESALKGCQPLIQAFLANKERMGWEP